MKTTRRQFLTDSGKIITGFGAASLMPGSAFSILKGSSANEKIVVGLIGCKGMGWSNLDRFLNVETVECKALCDVDQNVLNQRASELEERTGKKPRLYNDYRKLLEDKDIDAVIVATPDHWHCLQTVHACEAGRDVYVEKPVGRTNAECEVMVSAARRYKRVVQAGQWQRSGQHWKDAVDYVQSGKLGNIRVVKAWAYQGWMDTIPVKPDQQVPDGVDYKMWLGPAPDRPFNPNRFHFNFRWYWDYAGGLMTDWGVHLIDIVLYAMNPGGPKSIMSSGGKFGFPDDAMETPDTQQAIYEFEDFSMIWEHAAGIDGGPYGRNHGVAFIGNNGTLVVDRGSWEVLPETEQMDGKTQDSIKRVHPSGGGGDHLQNHVNNFLDAIKSRERPAADIEIAANTAIISNLGNIAFLTGEKLHWNHSTGEFKNNKKANSYLKPAYHGQWKFPEV